MRLYSTTGTLINERPTERTSPYQIMICSLLVVASVDADRKEELN